MKKYLFVSAFAFIVMGSGVALAHSAFNYPGTFTLTTGNHVEIVNNQNMQVELLSIGENNGGCPNGADSKCLGVPQLEANINNALISNSAQVKISTPGGCGANADPRCLGAPAYENITSIALGGYVNALGLKITVTNITENSATFKVSSSNNGNLEVRPVSIPTIKVTAGTSTRGSIRASTKLIVCPNGEVGENCSSCANGNCVPAHANSQSSSSPRLNLKEGETLVSVVNATSTATTSVEYNVKVKKKGRILFIFPVSSDITYSVNASTGASVVISKPWWSFIAW